MSAGVPFVSYEVMDPGAAAKHDLPGEAIALPTMKLLQRVLEQPLTIFIVALVLVLPGLGSGFAMDDYWFAAQTPAGGASQPAPAWDLYRLYPMPDGQGGFVEQPWYGDPAAKMQLFRPLASLLFYAEFQVAHDAAWVAQAMGFAWWLVCLGVVYALFKRLLPDLATARLALAIYAFDEGHAMALTWVSSRHLVLGTLLFAAAWLCELRREQEGFAHGRWLAPLLFLVSLLASESALALLPMMLLERGHRRWLKLGGIAWLRDSRVWLWLSIAAVWLCAYVAMGYGASHQDLYVSPWSSPLRFIQLAQVRVPALGLSSFLFFMSDFVILFEDSLGGTWAFFAVAGLILTVFFRWVLRRSGGLGLENPMWPWILGALAAAIVHASGTVQDRAIVTVSLASSVLLARMLGPWVCQGQTPTLMLRVLLVFHLILAPLLLPLRCFGHRLFAESQNGTALALRTQLDDRPPVFVTSPGLLRGAASLPMLAGMGIEAPKKSRTLVGSHGRTLVVRSAPQSLCITTEGGVGATLEDRLVHPPGFRHTVGSQFEVGAMRVEVEAIDAEGRVEKLCVHWPSSHVLEAEHLLYWTEAGFRPMPLPGLGQAVELPATFAVPHPLAEEAPPLTVRAHPR